MCDPAHTHRVNLPRDSREELAAKVVGDVAVAHERIIQHVHPGRISFIVH